MASLPTRMKRAKLPGVESQFKNPKGSPKMGTRTPSNMHWRSTSKKRG